jgi:hypothetical protein
MVSTKKLTFEIINERLKNRNIKMIGQYKNCNTHTKFLCLTPTCNNIWETKPGNVIGVCQSGCPECSIYNHTVTNKTIDEKFSLLNIERLSEYQGMNKIMTVKCKLDNHEWETRPGDILNSGNGCPECSIRNKFRTNEYIDEFIKNKSFIRISNYTDTFTPVRWKCKLDNHEWETKFIEIRRGSGCPACKNKTEKHIRNIIVNEYKILDLKCQYTIYGNNREYDIDFYFERGGNKIAVEYDGEQHYKPVRFGGISLIQAQENYAKQIIRDSQLKKLCNQYNIHLLNIPFWFKDEEIRLALSAHFYCFY